MPYLERFNVNWSLEEALKVIEMSTERYHVNVIYPVYFLSGRSLHTFNTVIYSKITGYVDEFTDMARQLVLPDGRKSELKGEYSTYTAIHRFITVMIDVYPYLGGAHPNHDILTTTFDTAANATITLSDFFAAGSDYLERLSTLSEKALFNKYPELAFAFNDPTYRKGFAPAKENFSRWALSDNGLIIFFPVYQVAPYAAGSLCVVIPYAAIKDIIQVIISS